MPMRPGDEFAGYPCLKVLHDDPSRQVYVVRHPRLPRRYTLTVFTIAVSSEHEFRDQFYRETAIASTLFHPHIAGIHDRGEYEGQLWIATDYVDGRTAEWLLRDEHSEGLDRDEVVAIVTAVAEALDYAHRQGVVHAGVSPESVVIAESESQPRRTVLTGFAVSKLSYEASSTGPMTGDSVAYTAPERLVGEGHDFGRADQYSLAANTFHLLTGSPPFVHKNPAVVVSRHLATPPPKLAELRPELADLDEALARALAKDPIDRFDDCLDFVATLTSSCPTSAPPVQPPPETITTAAPHAPLQTTEPGVVHSVPPVIISTWGSVGQNRERAKTVPLKRNSPPPRAATEPLRPQGRNRTPTPRSETNFWKEVGVDPIRIILNDEALFTLRCYVDDQADFLGYRRRIMAFPSRGRLTSYLAEDDPHDLSQLLTFRPVVAAARAHSLALPVTPPNTYVLDGLQRDIETGVDVIDSRQLELALELVLDVGDYTGDALMLDELNAGQPLAQQFAHVSDETPGLSAAARLRAAQQWRAISQRLHAHLRPTGS